MMTTSTPYESRSMLDTLARRFIVPVGLFLDVVGMVIRFTTVMMLLTLPTLYAGWQLHSNPLVAFAYYIAAFIAIGSVGLGVTGGLYMTMPLIYKVDKQIEAANRIKSGPTKRARLNELNAKRKRYIGYLKQLIVVIGAFGVSYFFGSMLNGTFVEVISGIAAIAAQIIVAYVITQTEREQNAVDAQERASQASTDIVVEQVRRIGEKFDGETLTKGQALSLQRGLDMDVPGMIDVLVPRDETVTLYTIADICRKLGVDNDRDDPNRKKIYRIITKAHKDGEMEIRRDPKTREWQVPDTLYDKLFGDFQKVPDMLRLVSDRPWTNRPLEPAPEAG